MSCLCLIQKLRIESFNNGDSESRLSDKNEGLFMYYKLNMLIN
jgi:hypothetical protein